MNDSRAQLAADQAMLLDTLLRGNRTGGFDDRGIDAAARVLISKRRKSVSKVCPAIAERLGSRFNSLFNTYAAKTPLTHGESALEDVTAFIGYLVDTRKLPPRVRLPLRSKIRRLLPIWTTRTSGRCHIFLMWFPRRGWSLVTMPRLSLPAPTPAPARRLQ